MPKKKNVQTSSELHVVLIGVTDYSQFRKGLPIHPLGKLGGDLRGPPEDLATWLRLARRLGAMDADIEVLADFGGLERWNGGITDPTAENIVRAIDCLIAKLRRDETRRGLVLYAGHGEQLLSDADSVGLALCGGDARFRPEFQADLVEALGIEYDEEGRPLGQVLSEEDVARTLGDSPLPEDTMLGVAMLGDVFRDARRVAQQLTVVLDCCFASPTGAVRLPDRHLTGMNLPIATLVPLPGVRWIHACGPQEPSQEGVFHGRWHSAFSWAAGSALDQWRVLPMDAGLSVGHDELIHRALQLLRDLDFPQTPYLGADPATAPAWKSLPLLAQKKPKSAWPAMAALTSPAPNVSRLRRQLDPDVDMFTKYDLILEMGGVLRPLAKVLVVNVAGFHSMQTSLLAATEYWVVHTANLLDACHAFNSGQAAGLRVHESHPAPADVTASQWVSASTPEVAVKSDLVPNWKPFSASGGWPQNGQHKARFVFADQSFVEFQCDAQGKPLAIYWARTDTNLFFINGPQSAQLSPGGGAPSGFVADNPLSKSAS